MVAESRLSRAAGKPRSWAGFLLAGHRLLMSIVCVLLEQLRLIRESLGPFETVGWGAALVMGMFHAMLRHAHHWIVFHAMPSALLVARQDKKRAET